MTRVDVLGCVAMALSFATGIISASSLIHADRVRPMPTYLLMIQVGGSDYVADFGLTMEDCRIALSRQVDVLGATCREE